MTGSACNGSRMIRTRSFPVDLRASGLSETPYSRALTAIGDGDSRRLQQVLADKRSKTLLQESGAELLFIASEKGSSGKNKNNKVRGTERGGDGIESFLSVLTAYEV